MAALANCQIYGKATFGTIIRQLQIWAKTLHSGDNVDKEITMNGQGEQGKPAEFLLRNLHPGSTYNVSITTTVSVRLVI